LRWVSLNLHTRFVVDVYYGGQKLDLTVRAWRFGAALPVFSFRMGLCTLHPFLSFLIFIVVAVLLFFVVDEAIFILRDDFNVKFLWDPAWTQYRLDHE
jgi:hypothetical protein